MRHHTIVSLGLVSVLSTVSPSRAFCQEGAPTGTTTATVTVTVDARHPWVDSGLTVRRNERLSFQAEGTIQWGAKPDQVAGLNDR